MAGPACCCLCLWAVRPPRVKALSLPVGTQPGLPGRGWARGAPPLPPASPPPASGPGWDWPALLPFGSTHYQPRGLLPRSAKRIRRGGPGELGGWPPCGGAPCPAFHMTKATAERAVWGRQFPGGPLPCTGISPSSGRGLQDVPGGPGGAGRAQGVRVPFREQARTAAKPGGAARILRGDQERSVPHRFSGCGPAFGAGRADPRFPNEPCGGPWAVLSLLTRSVGLSQGRP